ncbi:MAG: hypothetical protein WBQ20_17210 [Methyloceanibacter sp.]
MLQLALAGSNLILLFGTVDSNYKNLDGYNQMDLPSGEGAIHSYFGAETSKKKVPPPPEKVTGSASRWSPVTRCSASVLPGSPSYR